MTIREIAEQLHNLSGGQINGQHYTKAETASYIYNMFRGSLKLKNRLVMQIVLPDGEWLMTVNRFSNEPDGFDYTIPDTREQEQMLWSQLVE